MIRSARYSATIPSRAVRRVSSTTSALTPFHRQIEHQSLPPSKSTSFSNPRSLSHYTTMSRYASVHVADHLHGPGDGRPTALQILSDESIRPGSLKDRTFVITGCSSGIGIPTAQAIASTGARLYCTVRDVSKGETALRDILEPGRVELVRMDQNSLSSVRSGAATILERSGGEINVLIANAGVMAVPEGRTADGFETQFGVNHVSHFLLFQLLKDALLESAKASGTSSRVVMVASSGHRSGSVQFGDLAFEKSGYAEFKAYGQSKTSNIWMANEIERRYGKMGLHATSVMPGGINTGLQWNSPQIQEMMKDPKIIRMMKSPEQGAATTVWAAVGKEWEDKGGKYLENVAVAPPSSADGGYAPWAYDDEGARKLWNESFEMVGMKDDLPQVPV